MTRAEILSRLPDLPALEAKMEELDREKKRLYREWQDLRSLQTELRRVSEVFEGVPIDAHGDKNFQVHALGEDEYVRDAYVNPVDPPDDEISEDSNVPIPYRGWLLQLSGAGSNKVEREWKVYPPDARDAAVLAAKRFVAHGVVPLPDAARPSTPEVETDER